MGQPAQISYKTSRMTVFRLCSIEVSIVRSSISRKWVLAVLSLGLLNGEGLAAPRISVVSPRGLQAGATTLLTIEGTDLLPIPRLLLSGPIPLQAIRPGATPTRVQFEVTLPADLQPGMYHLRLATEQGASNPVVIGIDDLPEVPFSSSISQLPVALFGSLNGADVLKTTISGRKGQRLVIDLEARRLGANFDPLIELYDARHVQLAYAQAQTRLSGDARLEAVLPADGAYTVELHDVLFGAGSPSQFRMKMGELRYADLTFPLSWRRGSLGYVELLGEIVQPSARVQMAMDFTRTKDAVPAALPRIPGLVGPAPSVSLSDWPQAFETQVEPGKLQEISAPAVFHGRLAQPGEVDRIRVLVKPGMKLRFDLMANRANSPLDAVLRLENDAGGAYVESDDQGESTDPSLDFTVPANVTSVIVSIRDLLRRGGNNFVYRLTIRPADAPEYSITLNTETIVVPRGGRTLLQVEANRTGSFPIQLALAGLPRGVVVSGNEIPANASSALITLSADPNAEPGVLLTELRGEGQALGRVAHRPETLETRRQPWLQSDMALAVIPPSPIDIEWHTPGGTLTLGKPVTVQIQARRAKNTTGSVRFALVSTQKVPRTMDNKQEDRNRAVRFEGTPSVSASQSTGFFTLLVPGNISAGSVDLAVQAELLSSDGRSVVASAVSASKRFELVSPPAPKPSSAEPKKK